MTIAQQLKVKVFPFTIMSDSQFIYTERANGFWVRFEYDTMGNETYCEDSNGYWEKREWQEGKCIHWENSAGTIRKGEEAHHGLH